MDKENELAAAEVADRAIKHKKWRDTLAAHAMASIVGNHAAMAAISAAIQGRNISEETVVAKSAYGFADAMIAEGEK